MKTAQQTSKIAFTGITLIEKLQSNAEVHGLAWSATQFKRAALRQGKIANFDTFYYAVFGRFPRR